MTGFHLSVIRYFPSDVVRGASNREYFSTSDSSPGERFGNSVYWRTTPSEVNPHFSRTCADGR